MDEKEKREQNPYDNSYTLKIKPEQFNPNISWGGTTSSGTAIAGLDNAWTNTVTSATVQVGSATGVVQLNNATNSAPMNQRDLVQMLASS